MKNISLLFYFLLCVLYLFTTDLQAQCNSNSSGAWTTSSTWTACGGSIPTSSTNVTIRNDHNVTLTLTSNVTIASLTITTGGSLTVTGGFKLTITGNLNMNVVMGNNVDFFVSGGAFIDINGDFNSENNGTNVSIDGTGGGGSFLVRQCYRVGGGQPDPNVFAGTGLIWCVNGSCSSGNNSEGGVANACNTLLPVTLTAFIGRLINIEDYLRENQKMTELTWTTVNEINNDFYTLEKSADGKHFQPLAIVKGAGSFNQLKIYKEYDYTPFEGITYYRLKQTDYDGSYTYSKIISVQTETNLTIYPNPISLKDRQLVIHIKEQTYNELNVSILDMSGKVIYQYSFEKKQGNVYQLSLPAEVAQGIYLIHLKTDNTLLVKKLLVF